MKGQSPHATMRLQRDLGEHSTESVRAVRNRRRLGGRSHPTGNQGDDDAAYAGHFFLLL